MKADSKSKGSPGSSGTPEPSSGAVKQGQVAPEAVLFAKVKIDEDLVIQARRDEFGIRDDGAGPRHLGLAISGGGIRSATFSLGIIQYLAGRGILKHVDYLSTVSGGGYIGSWLYSWIRRQQKDERQPGLEGFNTVCKELNPENASMRPPGDPEPEEITFLRQYSNYLTPRVSVFNADTWLVFATWARNTILNLAILIAAWAAAVLLVRLLGLGTGQIPGLVIGAQIGLAHWGLPDWLVYDPWGFVFGLVALAFLVPMIWMMGRNLSRISKIALDPNPPAARPGEANDRAVILRCISPLLAAIVYGFWLNTAQDLFIQQGLLRGVAANGIYLFCGFFYLQVRCRVVQCHKAKLKEAGLTESTAASGPTWAMQLIGPAAAAFVTAGLLRAVAFVLSSRYDHPDNPWFTLTWGPPLVLLAFAAGVILHIGLMGRDLPDAAREWFGRLRGWLLIFTFFWVLVMAAAVYGPWLVAWIGVKSKTALTGLGAGWLLTTLGGSLAGSSARTSGRGRTDAVRPSRAPMAEFVARVGPYLFMAGFAVTVGFGIHAILIHQLNVPRQPETPPTLETYDLRVRNSQVQLSRDFPQTDDTGFEWIRNRYWLSLDQTELWVGDTQSRWVFSGLLLLLPVCVVAGLLLSWRVDINQFSMHNFYKNRLVRCYLGASRQRRRRPNPFTGFDDSDDELLYRFTPQKNGYLGPYPIVNATLNVTSGGKLQYQERQAQSFVFTPKYTGFSAETVVDEMRLGDESESRPALRRYAGMESAVPADDLRPEDAKPNAKGFRPTELSGGGVSVGMAVAISGAAVNPNMGYHTSTAVSFLLTVFNVRLGWWFANPLKPKFNGLGPTLGFLYSVRELFGMANADSNYVNLSDGGHFDNMGIYELVRRRCRYIICCDGEQDPGPSFGGIGNAIRKCRTDFGVEIDLPLDPLRKTDGLNRAHCVVGRIKYNPSGPEEDYGYLIYLKTSLTGDEPSDVLEYQARAPEFPQQTTGDQWFDESQFEAYRRLGYHAATKTFESGSMQDMERGDRNAFFRALYQVWYPPSAAVHDHSAAHADIYARVIEEVRKDGNLKNLDPALFPAFHPQDQKPVWNRDEALVCTALIQLMERIFYDLNLEDPDARHHPYVQGWLKIFSHWASTDAFQAAWKRTRESYPERFRKFFENR